MTVHVEFVAIHRKKTIKVREHVGIRYLVLSRSPVEGANGAKTNASPEVQLVVRVVYGHLGAISVLIGEGDVGVTVASYDEMCIVLSREARIREAFPLLGLNVGVWLFHPRGIESM